MIVRMVSYIRGYRNEKWLNAISNEVTFINHSDDASRKQQTKKYDRYAIY